MRRTGFPARAGSVEEGSSSPSQLKLALACSCSWRFEPGRVMSSMLGSSWSSNVGFGGPLSCTETAHAADWEELRLNLSQPLVDFVIERCSPSTRD